MPNVYLSINTTQFNINKHNFNYTYHHLFNVIHNSFIKMYSLVSEIDYQFVCHVASTKNHLLCFVLAAVIEWRIEPLPKMKLFELTILPLNIQKNYVFFFEQHHIDENVSINCVIVCATRIFISSANLWGSGSHCVHYNTMKYKKLMHFILKCHVFLISYDHLTPVPHQGSKCRLWQLIVGVHNVGNWRFKYSF